MRQQYRFGIKTSRTQVLRKHFFALLKGGLVFEDVARVIILNGNPCDHSQIAMMVMPLLIKVVSGFFIPLEHPRFDKL